MVKCHSKNLLVVCEISWFATGSVISIESDQIKASGKVLQSYLAIQTLDENMRL